MQENTDSVDGWEYAFLSPFLSSSLIAVRISSNHLSDKQHTKQWRQKNLPKARQKLYRSEKVAKKRKKRVAKAKSTGIRSHWDKSETAGRGIRWCIPPGCKARVLAPTLHRLPSYLNPNPAYKTCLLPNGLKKKDFNGSSGAAIEPAHIQRNQLVFIFAFKNPAKPNTQQNPQPDSMANPQPRPSPTIARLWSNPRLNLS